MADPLAPYADTIDAAAKEWGHDPNMLRALILQESAGNPAAVSSKGARGLTGIMPDTATGLGITDPADPKQQIFGAAKYLAEGRDKEGTHEGALLYYHGGPDWRNKYGPESAGYVPAVAAHYTALSKGAAAPGSTVPSDDDFLKQTAPPTAAAVPTDDDFLKSTGAASGAPKAGAYAGENTDPPDLTPDPRALAAIPKSVADLRGLLAPTPGWTAGGILPIRVKNDANGLADPALGVRPDLGPLRGAGNALLDLLEGTGQATSVGGPNALLAGRVSPEATNLLAGVAMGGGLTPSVARGSGIPIAQTAELGAPKAALYDGAAAQRTPAQGNLLADFPRPTEAAPNALAGNVPTMTIRPGEAAPQSVGAAASAAGESGITPAQELAYRSTAEGQKLLEPQPVGSADRNLYVHGSIPNTAEIEQTVNTARELKSLNVTAPAVSQEAKEIAATNNDARAQHYAQTAGSDVDVLNAREARSAQAEKDLSATWADKTAADASPVVDAAAQIKASPDGKRPLVRNAVDAVTKELFDKDGKLETDPEQLYGVRKHIDDLMSKEAGADDPKSVRAMANLAQLKTALDDAIEKAAPGFRQYLDNFTQASRRIDEMEVLQKHEPKLFDEQNRMGYNKVQTMMRQIVDSRQAPGLNPYKSITDDTMARLWALRDDLRRSASAQELARTPGSDTAQNVWDAAKGVMGGMAGEAAIHGTANMLLGPLGSPVAAIGKNVFNAMRAGSIQRKQTARGMELLHPDPSRLHNPLAGP